MSELKIRNFDFAILRKICKDGKNSLEVFKQKGFKTEYFLSREALFAFSLLEKGEVSTLEDLNTRLQEEGMQSMQVKDDVMSEEVLIEYARESKKKFLMVHFLEDLKTMLEEDKSSKEFEEKVSNFVNELKSL